MMLSRTDQPTGVHQFVHIPSQPPNRQRPSLPAARCSVGGCLNQSSTSQVHLIMQDALCCDAMRCDAMRCDPMRSRDGTGIIRCASCDAMRCDEMRSDQFHSAV
ncbi:hypothetical protein BJX76DRAFT_262252 [Aspergillus varians]